ncbi:zinc finger BED domain-containing protein RICESLEEPER 1-like [Lycium barbarum]|uniref:zinc finger BED domain-containing protein RICESLEEPER 1-like n=1 Tax=Lycium barbarum TaxID=112863 RepID=UPI00293E1297|nr:zinc finger BED domain-containing protein RICESLEEPER 1-like [Lycium barbarum]
MCDANDCAQQLYNHYSTLLDNATPTSIPCGPSNETSSTKRQAQSVPIMGVPRLSIWSQITPQQSNTNFDELQFFLRQPLEPFEDGVNALDWWRNNRRQFPVLSTMARDVLNVPMSTVASESAFS